MRCKKSGTVFAFDTKTKEYIYEVVPVEGKKNAGGLLITEDNKILGCADSCFFILDAKTGKKEYEKHVTEFNRVKDYKWEVTFIKKGPNRLYYMVIANRLFSYNHETKEIKSIYDKLVNLLEFDDTGRIYFQHEDSVREVYRSILPVE